ncbi:MAG: hypothetical protein V1672_00165 [Candidatus Diapherotrites archaeon]
MLIEALTHLVALDLDWFISLVMGNLHFVFALFAVIYMFFEGKNLIKGFFLIVFILWTLSEFEKVTNIAVFVGGFLTIYYLTKIALLAITEDSTFLNKYFVPISTIQAYVVLLFYNWFLM